ncbi:hypothetical protein GCM10011297_26070 [Bacterioplanes sanyensis]|uniref:Tll0287-like domain-containing protein n=1 Tax=Bacterioplanes sanyensis TaxID=1249553 RepID=UPI0019CB0284|nr:DUF3365 domain-containing protein [Bacterioplanes sanyensis]GGY52036.1 hypothetical protein GCM10011297_26070 [Bacterioplanes sanyensis]
MSIRTITYLMGLMLAVFSLQLIAAEQELQQARQLTQQFGKTLKQTLKASLQSDGPVAAIEVCNTEAPGIASQLSNDGWQVGRVSDRYRNPDNAPDEWEQQTLAYFEEQLAAGKDPATLERSHQQDGEFRYMKAIPTGPVCLACHGEKLSEPVQTAIQRLYPDDLATGFNVGQLRGAFSLTKTLNPPQ